MDKAIQKAREMERVGKQDLTIFIDESKVVKDNPLYLFETDKILEEELREATYGY